MMIRRIRLRWAPLICATLAGAAIVGGTACGKPERVERRTLIDSRDSYDPRSLDPALSTDVPTGRAVAYLFDGLTRFTDDAQVGYALFHISRNIIVSQK